MSFFSSIGNALSGVYNRYIAPLFRGGTSQSASALNYNNPLNNTLQTSRQNPGLNLPIVPGAFTPLPSGPNYTKAAASSIKAGYTPLPSGSNYTAPPIYSGDASSVGIYGNSFNTSNYTSPSYSGNAGSFSGSTQQPISTTVNSNTIGTGTTSSITPSSPGTTNYQGQVVGNNVSVGADPATGLFVQPQQTGTQNQNQGTQPDKAQQTFQDYINQLKAPASVADAYKQAEQESGVTQARQQLQNTQNQINGITTQMNTDLLRLRDTAAKEGVTEAVYGGQQAEVTREATIKLLPLQAQLAVDQGNAKLAEEHLNTLFDMYSKDAQNSIDFYNKNVDRAYEFFTTQEKKKADEVKANKEFVLSEIKDDNNFVQSLMLKALDPQTGNPSLYNALKNIRPVTNLNVPQEQLTQDRSNYVRDVQNALSKYASNLQTNNNVSVTTGVGNAQVPIDVAPYYNVSSSGVGYVDASTLQGTAKEKTQIIKEAQQAGLKVITNKNTAADLVNISDAKAKLQTVGDILSNVAQPSSLERTLYGFGLTKLAQAVQSDPRKAAAGALESIGLDILKAISGVQGFRGNQSAIQQVTDHLPKVTDTVATVNTKIDYINRLISDRENAAIGVTGNSTSNGTSTVAPEIQSLRSKYNY